MDLLVIFILNEVYYIAETKTYWTLNGFKQETDITQYPTQNKYITISELEYKV